MAALRAQIIQDKIKLKNDFPFYADKCLKICTKEGDVKPFILNKAQLYIHQQLENQKRQIGKVRAVILKARQMGISSYVAGRYYHITTHSRGCQCFILTNSLKTTNSLYKMAQRFYEHTPLLARPEVKTNNSKELNFGLLDSGYKIGTAETKTEGRGTTIQLSHNCLAFDTLVYDPSIGSVRHIQDFKIGDLVLTHTGGIATVSFISSQEKECISVKFRGLLSFPLVATKEHKFFTPDGWKELGELQVGDSIGYPVSKIYNSFKKFPMPKASIKKQGGGRQFLIPEEINITYELGRIIGLYLAEGHLKLQYKYPHNPSHIEFAVHRKETERTLEWLMPFNDYFSSINVKYREDCLTTIIKVYGNQFVGFINYWCGRVKDKHFPRGWASFGENFCKGMLHGYISGDGYVNKTSKSILISSIHSSLSITCRDIMASLGYGWASIKYMEGAIRGGRNEKAKYTIILCGDGARKLTEEIGKPLAERIVSKVTSNKNYAPHVTEINNGYAWVRIKNIENAGLQAVYDFEVNHEDHSYCIIHGAAKNSECAFWNNAGEIFKGLLQAVPDVNGTEIIFESTANGIGNFFHQMYQKAESGLSDYIPIFVPWHWQNEYKRESQDDLKETEKELFLQQAYSLTKEQLAWRRNKIIELSIDGQDGEKVFSVEYPSDAAEAFQLSGEDTFISPELVMRARKTKCEPYGPKICGVDVARFGEDRTCIVIRQGRVVLYLKTFKKIDNMEIVGILVQLIEEYKLSKVFIDLGGGSGIIDRLNELGNRDIVVGVNFGSKPFNHERFLNKRSEMFGLFRDWLEDAPVQLIDSNELQGDLCNIKYSYDSNSRLVMEPKEKMKARGLRSCDLADALILTFSMPPSAYDIMHKSNNIVKSLAGDFREKMNVINKARQEVKSNSW